VADFVNHLSSVVEFFAHLTDSIGMDFDLIRIASGKNRSAIRIAERAHRGIVRKSADDVPYIVHPIAVAEVGAAVGLDRNGVCACILHDTPEDTDYSLDMVRQEFGDNVAFLVEGVTKTAAFKQAPLAAHGAMVSAKLDAVAQSLLDADPESFEVQLQVKRLRLDATCVKGADLLINMGDLVLDAEHQGVGMFATLFGPERVSGKINHYLELADALILRLTGSRYDRLAKALAFRADELNTLLNEYLAQVGLPVADQRDSAAG
jgi:(p)ppGpp synthase/HD superfamily hydrolase